MQCLKKLYMVHWYMDRHLQNMPIWVYFVNVFLHHPLRLTFIDKGDEGDLQNCDVHILWHCCCQVSKIILYENVNLPNYLTTAYILNLTIICALALFLMVRVWKMYECAMHTKNEKRNSEFQWLWIQIAIFYINEIYKGKFCIISLNIN